MKKAFLLLLVFSIFLFSFSVAALALSAPSVVFDGNAVSFDVPPCIVDGRTLVPIRSVLESFGATVGWDSESRMTVASNENTIVWIGIDNPAMTVQDGETTSVVQFDVPPCIIGDRTFVAIKPVAEAFGISVGWDAASSTVILETVITDTIHLSGFTPPLCTKLGSPFIIIGNIDTDGILDRVNVKITDRVTGKVQINTTSFDINAASYNLSEMDNRVKFGILTPGQKLMEITAVTKNETRKTFAYDFEVQTDVGVNSGGESYMLWPVPSSGVVTTIFWCDNPLCHSNAQRPNGHSAIDISANENDSVVAVKDGTVIKTGSGDDNIAYAGYGNFIVVDHGNGLTTQYSHLYSIYVSEGDTVYAGQVIGGVGNTGNSTGNHLDFCIEKDGKRIDPLYCLELHPDIRCTEECDKPYFDAALEKYKK